jgi:hypothetical protein
MGRSASIRGLALLAVVLGTSLGLSTSASANAGISAKVRAELLRDAKREAARPPYRQRHLLDIRAVLTTETQAWALENESRKQDLSCGECGSAEVYLVAMLGGSRLDCKGGPGVPPACPSHPPVFMFWVSPSTMKVSRAARAGSYPNLTSVGVPVNLGSG